MKRNVESGGAQKHEASSSSSSSHSSFSREAAFVDETEYDSQSETYPFDAADSSEHEPLSFGDQSSAAASFPSVVSRADGDSNSISGGVNRKHFDGNRVSSSSSSSSDTTSESGSKRKTTGNSSVSGFNRNPSRSDPTDDYGTSAIRRLNSSNPSGTLRLKSSGKSLHQQQQQQQPHQQQSDCSFKQLMEAVQYTIVVDRYNILEKPSDSGMVRERVKEIKTRLLYVSSNNVSTSTILHPLTFFLLWPHEIGYWLMFMVLVWCSLTTMMMITMILYIHFFFSPNALTIGSLTMYEIHLLKLLLTCMAHAHIKYRESMHPSVLTKFIER